MICWVVERALAARNVSRAIVATDDERIVAAVESAGYEAVMTSAAHRSGTDRIAEVAASLADADVIVNVQGDEPLMAPQLVRDVAQLLAARPEASMSTAAHAIDTLEDWHNPNIVKVVLAATGLALYFSRAAIPFARDFPNQVWWQGGQASGRGALLAHAAPLRHIGIYAYRAGFLRLFPRLAQAPTEVAEALEQLRAMWHGHRIAVHISPTAPGPGVDTPADLERVRQIFAA